MTGLLVGEGVDEVLTSSVVGDATEELVAEVLAKPPVVPEGWLLKAMYPYRPRSAFPHLSEGYPGQF